MNLDLNSIDPWEFELLVGELLRADRGWDLEVFMAGPDGGIDLRCLTTSHRLETVVQCKRYAPSAFRTLERAVKREVTNLVALEPERYVLVTSVPLTPARKDKLAVIVDQWLVGLGDILGNEDLQAACRRYPDVLRGFPNLWLGTLPLIQRFLNTEVQARTEHFLQELPERRDGWVNTPSYGEALALLERTHMVIVSGQPGVGKTHLAQMLTLTSIADGYEPVVISQDIGEIEAVWNDSPQLFVFDDFLGQISLGRLSLNRNETQRIRAIVRRIQRSESKRLILTTREYILSEAAESFEGLEDLKRSISKATIEVTLFSRVVRAAILASHLRRATVTQEQRRAFLRDPRRFEIVDHRKFNPRSIEHATRSAIESDNLAATLLDELENPWRTWQHIYTNLAGDVRLALQVIYTLGEFARYDVAEMIWACITGAPTQRTFDNCVRVLTDSMIQVDDPELGGGRKLRMVDPSVRDFLSHRLRDQGAEVDRLIGSLAVVGQLRVLDSQVGLAGERACKAFRTALDLITAASDGSDISDVGDDLLYLAHFGAEAQVPELASAMAPLITEVLASPLSSCQLLLEALYAASTVSLPASDVFGPALERITGSILGSTTLDDWSILEEAIPLWEEWPDQAPESSSLASAAHALTSAVLDGEHSFEDANLLLDLLALIRDDLHIDTAGDLERTWDAWRAAGGDDIAIARQNMAWLEVKVVRDRWERWSRNQSDAEVDAALAGQSRQSGS